jgi:hypothetical protein
MDWNCCSALFDVIGYREPLARISSPQRLYALKPYYPLLGHITHVSVVVHVVDVLDVLLLFLDKNTGLQHYSCNRMTSVEQYSGGD